MAKRIDVYLADHGTIVLLHLETARARNWVRRNVSGEATFWGGALVVEHRYVMDIGMGMKDAGLRIAPLGN